MQRETRDSMFVKRRLESGGATGATRFKTLDGAGVLRIRVGERGRGLFAVTLIRKGILFVSCVVALLTVRCCTGQKIATGSGKLVSRPDEAPGLQLYKWFDERIFAFDPPSDGNLAVLVNTSLSMEGSAVSNARYARIKSAVKINVRWPRCGRSNAIFQTFLQVVATRAIQPGEEILAPYGLGFRV